MEDTYRVMYIENGKERLSIEPLTYEKVQEAAQTLRKRGKEVVAILTEESAQKRFVAEQHEVDKRTFRKDVDAVPATLEWQEEHPTLPQIVRALTTLSDRQADEKQALRDEYNEIINKKDRTITEYDRAANARDDRIEAQQQVIEDLLSVIGQVRRRAVRDLERCVDVDAAMLIGMIGGTENRLYELVDVKLRAIRRDRAEQKSEGEWQEGELPDDICVCEHARKRHTPRPGVYWAGHQCDACPGDSERVWRHKFELDES